MSTATVTSKGQITIPAAVRRELGLAAGVQVEFVRDDDGQYRLVPKKGSLRDLKGSLPAPERPVTLREMDAAITAGAASALPQ
jgi:antitoxin PrlF